MKEILFCHDYQNRNGCNRVNCKFIHATKEEEEAFNTTRQVPRVSAERHAALGSGPANMSNAETIPQIAMFINESYNMTQPPPAPWPPLPPPQAAATAPSTSSAPPPPPAMPRLAPALQPAPLAQQPPPPPAPSPAPLASSTATPAPLPVHRLCPTPNYASQGAPVAMFPINQTLPMVPHDFDASKPPPPLPTHLNTNKRKLDANGCAAAGPSKTRKECPEGQDGFCESCSERKRRIDGYKMQMDALHNEEETQILLYKKKLQEYEMGRDILKSLVEPDLFRLFDDLIEGVQSPRESLTNFNSANPSFVSGTSAEPMQAMFKFFQMMLGGSVRNEPVPSTSREDDIQAARRLNITNYSNQSPDLINLVIETFRNNTQDSSRSPALEARSDRLGNNRNGLNHLANGQKPHNQTPSMETSRYQPTAPGYTGAGMMGQDFGAHAVQAVPNYPVAGPSGYGGAGHTHTPLPQAPYPIYHPAIPPNRHYYGQNSSVTNFPPNMGYNGTSRTPVPGPSQGLQPSTSSALPRPAQPNTSKYNQMGRQ